MSDSFATQIEIGGKLKLSDLAKFIELASDCATDWDGVDADESYVLDTAAEQCTVKLFNVESVYGMFEDMEAFCCEHGLTWVRKTEGKYEYNAEIVFWRPRMASTVTLLTTQDGGELIITLSELQTALDVKKTLRKVIRELDIVPTVPPLEIV